MNPDETIPVFLGRHGFQAAQEQLKIGPPGPESVPLEERAPIAAMRFECYRLTEPRPKAEDLILCLGCYFGDEARKSDEQEHAFRFGDRAEVTVGQEPNQPVGMFTVLYLKVD